MIAVRDLDKAAADFRALGFTLTPRGHHSTGSQNHCIMFGSTYIELLAPLKPHPWLHYYRAFLGRGDGLAAVALSTDDADATHAELTRSGVVAKSPMDLSRPVEGGVARFRLIQPEEIRYAFVCQHLTRDLVWRPEWRNAGELVSVSMPMQQPFEGLPPSIEWGKPAALRIRGAGKTIETHGVRLEYR